jgi:nicotinamide mononucleotide (NMN) deamidase PncC
MSNTIKDQAARIMKIARERCMTLATVESCTAGSLAHLLSQAEGASDRLHGGFVVYTKDNKAAVVGVPKEMLAARTAVSGEVARPWLKVGYPAVPPTSLSQSRALRGPNPMRTAIRSGLSM